MVQALRVQFEVVTPLFMAGASQKRCEGVSQERCEGASQERCELRAASLKGLLRFWLRAVDPDFLKNEAEVFGGSGPGQGQSAVLLRLESETPRQRPTFKDFKPERFTQGRGKDSRNGLIYLGYPFQMSGNEDRTSLPPGHVFRLRCLLPRGGDGTSDRARAVRRRLVAALWLLGHFGGGGCRARRGFGGLSLTAWEPETVGAGEAGPWPELEALPLAARTNTVAEADRALIQGLETLGDWFPPAADRRFDHPHLGPDFRFRLQSSGVAKADWAQALAGMGLAMQRFRADMASRDPGDAGGDTPARASFGLPLTFRFSTRRSSPLTLVPFDETGRKRLERHGSLLLLRLLAVGPNLYPLYVRLDGAVPGAHPPAVVRGQSRRLRPARFNAMDAFFDSLTVAGRP